MMNRRAFLTGVLAACLVPAWEEAEPDLSSEQAIDQAWDELLKNPVAFFVQPGGSLGLGLGLEPESPPQTRAEAFDLSLPELESPSRLNVAADRVPPLQWELHRALDDLRDEFVDEVEDWQTGRQFWCERSGQPEAEYPSETAIGILRDLPEEVEVDNLENVLQALPEGLFGRLRARLADWLQDEPNWAWEEDHFAPWFRQQEGALEYFQDLGFSRDVLRELGIKIVEGEHPGSNYYAAELHLPIVEANRHARQLGIPVMFMDHDNTETNTAAGEGA